MTTFPPASRDLFHVSAHRYRPGQLVGPFAKSQLFLSRERDPAYRLFERHLDRFRPARACPRASACFAFSTVEACEQFWEAEQTRRQVRSRGLFYRVVMPDPTPAAFAVANEIFFRLRDGQGVRRWAEEYWSPKQPWRVLEHLDRSFKVLAEVPGPEGGDEIRAAFSSDAELARSLGAREPPG